MYKMVYFSRESAVRSILNQHIELTDDETCMEKEELIKEKLMVPKSWIHHAKVCDGVIAVA